MPRGKRKQEEARVTGSGKRSCTEEEFFSRGGEIHRDETYSLPSTSQEITPSSHNVSLTSLPLIVLTKIIDSLFPKDICTISCVNKFFSTLIPSLYTPLVTLPWSPPPHPRHTPVLCLRLSANLSPLPPIESYHPLQLLNLNKLKQLELTGKNHIWNKQYLLSDKYKHWLEYFLTSLNKVSLQQLEFLTDESKQCVEIVRSVSTFHNLTEVTLHGIGYFNPTASYHMDKDIAQKIINSVLINKRIKILRLKSFQTLNRCIVLESESLEELYVDFGKNFEIGLLYLPEVRIISMETSMWFGCFYHAQNGELKKIVAQGCPKLESFNGINVTDLSESGHWVDQLRSFSASKQQGEGQCILCTMPETDQ